MGQVVSDGLDWAGWRILHGEYFSRPNRLRGREARLDGFSSMAPNRQLLYSARSTLFPVEFSWCRRAFRVEIDNFDTI